MAVVVFLLPVVVVVVVVFMKLLGRTGTVEADCWDRQEYVKEVSIVSSTRIVVLVLLLSLSDDDTDNDEDGFSLVEENKQAPTVAE